LASSSDPINLRISENRLDDLPHQTTIVREFYNPDNPIQNVSNVKIVIDFYYKFITLLLCLQKNEQPVTQETTNPNFSNR